MLSKHLSRCVTVCKPRARLSGLCWSNFSSVAVYMYLLYYLDERRDETTVPEIPNPRDRRSGWDKRELDVSPRGITRDLEYGRRARTADPHIRGICMCEHIHAFKDLVIHATKSHGFSVRSASDSAPIIFIVMHVLQYVIIACTYVFFLRSTIKTRVRTVYGVLR